MHITRTNINKNRGILEISTSAGDLVLDAFLGSGTTTAVAHKLNRNYIGIESSNRTYKYAIERMNKVIAGEKGGISKAVKWTGGGEVCVVEDW